MTTPAPPLSLNGMARRLDQLRARPKKMRVADEMAQALRAAAPGESIEPLADWAEEAGMSRTSWSNWLRAWRPEVLALHQQRRREHREARRQDVALRANAGEPLDDIADDLGVSITTVRGDLISMGLLRQTKRKVRPAKKKVDS